MLHKIMAMLLLALVAGCSSVEISKERPELTQGVLSEEYRIGVSDQLQISVWRNADLSVSVPVRPDGKISVPLVGDVAAAGRTTEELAEDITISMSSFVRSPEVTVIVISPNSANYLQRVRVTGAVNSPQSLVYQQGMTVLDVVLQSGGVTAFGVPNGCLLYRQTSEGLKVYPVYLKDILEKGRLDTNYELAPSDILTVPERTF
ncbi:MAG: XrtA/PEP-CTERM system exopolysaccharide export protein [Spongiibacteraceae bacterium]